jgi:hypothetical protein
MMAWMIQPVCRKPLAVCLTHHNPTQNSDATGLLDNPGSNNTYTLIQLPAGTLNLVSTIYLSSNYLILRGAGNDPSDGTVLSFSPDKNTVYDVLTKPNGDNVRLIRLCFV